MTGCEPDDEQDFLPACINLARSVGLDEYLAGAEPWHTMKLGSPEPPPVTDMQAESPAGQAQIPAEAGNPEAPELNRRIRYSLTEDFADEWDSTLSEKKDLENVLLIPKLKRFIPGFDDSAVNWDDFTLQESIDFFTRQIATGIESPIREPRCIR